MTIAVVNICFISVIIFTMTGVFEVRMCWYAFGLHIIKLQITVNSEHVFIHQVDLFVCVCVCVCMCVCVCVCVHACMHVCLHSCVSSACAQNCSCLYTIFKLLILHLEKSD